MLSSLGRRGPSLARLRRPVLPQPKLWHYRMLCAPQVIAEEPSKAG